ncbi:MAG: P-II family nitrogen regulator, partial [Rhodothermales bacterium]
MSRHSVVPLKLVTIVTERILEDRLLRTLLDLGAKGYTLTQATGKG